MLNLGVHPHFLKPHRVAALLDGCECKTFLPQDERWLLGAYIFWLNNWELKFPSPPLSFGAIES